MKEITKYNLWTRDIYQKLCKLNKRLLFTIIILFQQLTIFYPVLNRKFEPHRWGDDFVIGSHWYLKNLQFQFLPNSFAQWIERVRSRAYLSEVIRSLIRAFHENYHALALFFVSLWIIGIVLFFISIAKFLRPEVSLICALLLGAMPYRIETLLYAQGDGYILVFLMVILAALLVIKANEKRLSLKFLLRVSSVLLFYLSLYLYEIATITALSFTLLILYLHHNSKERKFSNYIYAFSFPVLAGVHSLIIVTSTNPTWNRSGLHNLTIQKNLEFLASFTHNYFWVMMAPLGWLVRDNSEIIRFFKIILESKLFPFYFILFTTITFFSIFKIPTLVSIKEFALKPLNQKRHKVGKNRIRSLKIIHNPLSIIFGIGIPSFLLLSPYIGFLTFSGGFPWRLTLLSNIGFVMIVGFWLNKISKDNSRNFLIFKSITFIFILYFTLCSAFQIQSISSVSKYDKMIEERLFTKIGEMGQSVKLPILVNLPIPPCQAIGFWKWNPSIWEGNSGQLNLAEDLGLIYGRQGEFAQVIYIPKNQPADTSKISSGWQSDFSCNINSTRPSNYASLASTVIFNKAYSGNTQFAFDRNLEIYEVKP